MKIYNYYGRASEQAERAGRGNSLLALVSDYVVVDLETTGLSPRFDEIIEIGAIRVENGSVTDSFSSLVNPDREISGFIKNLTGITNEMLLDAPDIASVLPCFLEFVGRSVVVGHNVNFDVNFLYDNCVKVLERAFGNDYIDTMRLSRKLFPQHRRHRLCDLIERFDIGLSVEHRGLADVMQTHQCYEYIKRYIKENGISIGRSK